MARAGAVHLQKNYVTGTQPKRGELNCSSRTETAAVRYGANICIWRNAIDAKAIDVPDYFAKDCGSVISPVYVGIGGATDQSTTILKKVYMGELPTSFDIDDPDTRASPTRHRPGEFGINAVSGGVEIALSCCKVGRQPRCERGYRGLKRFGRTQRIFDSGLHVNRFNQIRLLQAFDQRLSVAT